VPLVVAAGLWPPLPPPLAPGRCCGVVLFPWPPSSDIRTPFVQIRAEAGNPSLDFGSTRLDRAEAGTPAMPKSFSSS